MGDDVSPLDYSHASLQIHFKNRRCTEVLATLVERALDQLFIKSLAERDVRMRCGMDLLPTAGALSLTFQQLLAAQCTEGVTTRQ
mmetsp:Transcript_49019/g.87382  ORF Transcript_49019/g.87382 Transcript_49019/m.87382 type:complete len:85 (+) Transcript_49019:2891-3145(+)